MLVTQSVCCDVFDGDVWLDKYCAKIFAIGIFLRILTGIDTPPEIALRQLGAVSNPAGRSRKRRRK